MHKLLSRQLRRCFGSPEALPADLVPFISLVDTAYRESDDDRHLIEHSMETVSGELIDGTRRVRQALAESQRAEFELNKTLSVLEAIIESTTDGLLVVDANGRMVRMNRKFAELWRIPQEILDAGDDAMALSFVLQQLEEPEEFLRKVRELYATPEAESVDTLRFKDHRVFERYSQPNRVNGVTTGRVWSFRDMTSRLELEDQLRQSQKMDAIGRLAGGVAHDFNNVLTVISGHAELLQACESLSTGQQEDLAEIVRATGRAARLTQQLLAFSRRQILRPVELDLNNVVAELEPMLVRLIGADIEFDSGRSQRPAMITADRGQMEQVLVNLVVNARDAMPSGGRLSLRVANLDLQPLSPRRAPHGMSGPHVLMSVMDTGHGISPESMTRIFEPFFTTKDVGKGTGLGLATVYGIVQQSKGFIDVESAVGLGTTFEVYFPAATNQMPMSDPVEVRPARPARTQGTETVLVVEDEDALRQLARRTLEAHGYTVLAAQSGRDALSLVLDHDGVIDLVVTDVVMPLMGGPELVKHLCIARPGVPVLYVSGYTDDEVVRRGVVQAETAFLQKPFTIDQFVRAVRDALDAGLPSVAAEPCLPIVTAG